MFSVADLSTILVGSAISTLPHFAFFSHRELTKKQWLNRRIIHFIILEITVLVTAHLLFWLHDFNLLDHVMIASCVLVVYLLVWLTGWGTARAESEKINKKLKELNEENEELQ